MPISFDHPALLWLLLLIVPVAYLGIKSLKALDKPRRWTAITVRCLLLILLVVLLAEPQAVTRHTDLTVMAVIDESDSVRRFARIPGDLSDDGTAPISADDPGPGATSKDVDRWIRRWIREAAQDRKTDDRLGVVTFDGRPWVRLLPSRDLDLTSNTVAQPTDGTDAAAAIRLGMVLFPADSGKRMMLVWDGNDTSAATVEAAEASVIAAAREAAAAGVPIDVLPLDYGLRNEVMVEGVYAPTEARTGQTVALRVALKAAWPTAGQLFVKHDGVLIDLSPDQAGDGSPITTSNWTTIQEARDGGADGNENGAGAATNGGASGRYVCVRMLELPLAYKGANRFEAIFEPAEGGDAIMANNRSETFTLVHGKGQVLFVDHVGGDSGAILPAALQEHGIDVQVVGATGFPLDLLTLQRYDAVVFQNVPAELISPVQQKMLAQYVNELGGGFVMIGGPDSFGAGGWTHSVVDRILPVECEIPSQTVLPSGALMLVLDRSGSMSSPVGGTSATQQELANEAAILAVRTLYDDDLVGVVAFDDSAKWISPLQPARKRMEVINRIRSIHPGGGTNIYSGLVEAYEALKVITPQEAAVKHVILLTDGQSQSAQYFKIVGQMMKAGITISTVGVGDGHDAGLLSRLAQMGGGNYHPVRNPSKLPQVFIKEARSIRKNLIREVEFVPKLNPGTGSPVVAGLRSSPPLKGLVLTGKKQDPRIFLPLLGPEEEPLFAHWQVGLGRTAAFTSDATNRWAIDWLTWGGYGDLWARTIRMIARPSASRGYDLSTHIENGMLRVRLDASGGGEDPAGAIEQTGAGGAATRGSFSNFLKVGGTVLTPGGDAKAIELRQTGPGIYEAAMPLSDDGAAGESGSYIVSLFAQDGKGQRHAVFGGANRPPGAELRNFAANLSVMEQVASITGGRLLDPSSAQVASLFNRDMINETRSLRPLWRSLLPWLLVLFLLDVALRRVAWDIGAMRQWAMDRLDASLGLLRSRQQVAEESQATLGALKKRAAEFSETMQDESGGRDRRSATTAATAAGKSSKRTAPVTGAATEASTDAGRKFDAAEDAVADEDFAAAVGAATIGDDDASRTNTSSKQDEADAGGTTTKSLLDAKRRARSRMSDG